MSTFRLAQLNQELAIAKALGPHGDGIHAGVTDVRTRMARARAAIAKVGPDRGLGRDKRGDLVTLAQAFAKTYGEPLTETHENGDGV